MAQIESLNLCLFPIRALLLAALPAPRKKTKGERGNDLRHRRNFRDRRTASI